MHLKSIIFDWAGTVVDFGSLCPISAFQATFKARGISVSAKEVHRFMGVHKRDHIRALLSLPEVSADWQKLFGRPSNTEDIDALYHTAEKMMVEAVADLAIPTPHLMEALADVRKLGLRIGSTTGYTSPMMERLVPAAKRRGYDPEFWIASDQVPQGRPWPWMIFRNMEHFGICPPATVVKIGDTLSDIEEANNAGVWAIGIVESSSLVGMSEAEFKSMPARSRDLLVRKVSKQFIEAGAHSVIRNLSELKDALEKVNERLEKGQLPPQHKRHPSSNSASGWKPAPLLL